VPLSVASRGTAHVHAFQHPPGLFVGDGILTPIALPPVEPERHRNRISKAS
jgi:hypothetical protein